MCEACACGADSACEGSAYGRGAWLRCAVGCWAVSDMAGCGGRAWIWLLVVLRRDKRTVILYLLRIVFI